MGGGGFAPPVSCRTVWAAPLVRAQPSRIKLSHSIESRHIAIFQLTELNASKQDLWEGQSPNQGHSPSAEGEPTGGAYPPPHIRRQSRHETVALNPRPHRRHAKILLKKQEAKPFTTP